MRIELLAVWMLVMFAAFGVLAWIALDALRQRPKSGRRVLILMVHPQRKRLCAVSSRR
ncbi:hypothetical protein D3C83_149660 [compost metagenome]